MMGKKDLEKRIRDLEKQLELKDKIIKTQEDFIKLLQKFDKYNAPHNTPYVNFDYDNTCPAGGEHDFPSPWFGVIPPHCKKCGTQGKQMEITFGKSNIDSISSVVCTSNTIIDIENGEFNDLNYNYGINGCVYNRL